MRNAAVATGDYGAHDCGGSDACSGCSSWRHGVYEDGSGEPAAILAMQRARGCVGVMVDEIRVWPTKIACFRSGSCHLTTTGPLDELHAFAKRLGLKHQWFQDHALAPHYDLTPRRRQAAIRLGAAFVPMRALFPTKSVTPRWPCGGPAAPCQATARPPAR